mgnify:CR=1 FL=1
MGAGGDPGAVERAGGEHPLNPTVAMRDAGVAVLVVSTELDEILGLSDRVLVMNEGHITGELSREEADEPSIGRLMAHSKKGAGHQAAAPETPSEGVAP